MIPGRDVLAVFGYWIAVAGVCAAQVPTAPALHKAIPKETPTFHKNIEAILQRHCQECHRPGEAAPMPLLTFAQTRPWAKAIRSAVLSGKMPPWHADSHYGKFSNDPSLAPGDRETLIAWIDAGAPEGNAADSPRPRKFTDGWRIPNPDVVFEMPGGIQCAVERRRRLSIFSGADAFFGG